MQWEALTAISVAILAAMSLVLVAVVAVALGRMRRLLDRNGQPLLQAARSVAEDAGKIVSQLRGEVEQIVATSRDLRQRAGGAAMSLEERARDLEAVLDILQDEVEDTALDVAAALRATRRGTSVIRAVKRAFLRGRR
jgi:methyl-accepting chemotaxis protein